MLILNEKTIINKDLNTFLKEKERKGFNLDDSFIIYLKDKEKLSNKDKEKILQNEKLLNNLKEADKVNKDHFTDLLLFNNINGEYFNTKSKKYEDLQNIQSILYVAPSIGCSFWLLRGFVIKKNTIQDTYLITSYSSILEYNKIKNYREEMEYKFNKELEDIDYIKLKTIYRTLDDIEDKTKLYYNILKNK